jgi:uroporphyrinogen decarboxylase
MSEFIEFPVKSRRDWQRYRKERLDPDDPQRLAGDWLERARGWVARGEPVQLGSYPDVGIFGSVRWLLGDEECLIAFIEQPDLVHEIMDHMTDIYLSVFNKVVSAGVRVDVIHIWEDMCGRQGPLISPAMWDEFMSPCYRRIKRFADKHGIPLISVDTDGRPDLIVPNMMAAGVNYIYPWEVAAGCDVNAVRARWPELGLMGGFDKRVLVHSRSAIDRELERIRPAMEKGRYIPELDHLIPSVVQWENFFYFCQRRKELVGK